MSELLLTGPSYMQIDQLVMIGDHSYHYKGQRTVKKSGIKKTVYLFKGITTETDQEYNVTTPPVFKLENGILKKT